MSLKSIGKLGNLLGRGSTSSSHESSTSDNSAGRSQPKSRSGTMAVIAKLTGHTPKKGGIKMPSTQPVNSQQAHNAEKVSGAISFIKNNNAKFASKSVIGNTALPTSGRASSSSSHDASPQQGLPSSQHTPSPQHHQYSPAQTQARELQVPSRPAPPPPAPAMAPHTPAQEPEHDAMDNDDIGQMVAAMQAATQKANQTAGQFRPPPGPLPTIRESRHDETHSLNAVKYESVSKQVRTQYSQAIRLLQNPPRAGIFSGPKKTALVQYQQALQQQRNALQSLLAQHGPQIQSEHQQLQQSSDNLTKWKNNLQRSGSGEEQSAILQKISSQQATLIPALHASFQANRDIHQAKQTLVSVNKQLDAISKALS